MLKSLEITNFRLLEHFQVSKLGRVNLIVGRNNSGKSSVLEALRIYAGNAQHDVLQKIALAHNERALANQTATDDADVIPFESLFSGRRITPGRSNTIAIGPTPPSDAILTIDYGHLTSEEIPGENDGEETRVRTRFSHRISEDSVPCLRVGKGRRTLFNIRLDTLIVPSNIRAMRRDHALPCSFIPTQFVSLGELADEWDKIALTDAQTVITEALKIIIPEFEALTFVRDVGAQGLTRIAKVKLSTFSRPVPLNSLGDGVVRLLQLVLKLFPAKGGFYLIDEFENGLHFSVQEKIWELLFRMARKLDIQIFATTHSWDCIESFARAARADQDAEGLLFRVGQSVRTSDRGRTIATVFDEEQLYSITQADVEVR